MQFALMSLRLNVIQPFHSGAPLQSISQPLVIFRPRANNLELFMALTYEFP
jgi:hypothetical protein